MWLIPDFWNHHPNMSRVDLQIAEHRYLSSSPNSIFRVSIVVLVLYKEWIALYWCMYFYKCSVITFKRENKCSTVPCWEHECSQQYISPFYLTCFNKASGKQLLNTNCSWWLQQHRDSTRFPYSHSISVLTINIVAKQTKSEAAHGYYMYGFNSYKLPQMENSVLSLSSVILVFSFPLSQEWNQPGNRDEKELFDDNSDLTPLEEDY